ncbi:MAG: metallophosphoesterase [Candidatus Saccharibacteria bacterium]|nr:metallophosphoesterase [Candidatus Saccharibacteria bacterium]
MERSWQQNALRIAEGALLGAAALTPPVTGAIMGLTHPAKVEIAPGITPEVTPQLGSTSNVDLGVAGGFDLPQIHSTLPLIGHTSVKVSFGQHITIANPNRKQLTEYAALQHNPDKAIRQPVVQAIRKNTITGALVATAGEGLAIEAGVFALSFTRKRRRVHEEKVEKHMQALQAAGVFKDPHIIETLASLVGHHPLFEFTPKQRRLQKAAACLGIMALGTTLSLNALQRTIPESHGGVPVSEQVVALDEKDLRGATVYGTAAEFLINNGGEQAINFINGVDRKNATVAQNTSERIKELSPSVFANYLNNPNYTTTAVVADIHCNLSWMQTVLPVIINNLGVKILINAGDTEVSTGTLPYESDCISTLGDALKPTSNNPEGTDMVAVMGNHDSTKRTAPDMRSISYKLLNGKKHSPISVLDSSNNFTATVDGLTFVGSPDPRQSVANTPIQPNSPEDQNKAIAKQGSSLADAACAATKKNGIAPIELSHDKKASYASLVRRCASIAFSGHLHRQSIFANYGGEYIFNQGTSSGVGDDQFTEYAPINRDAPVTIFIFNNETKQPEFFINIVSHKDLSVSQLKLQPMPAKVTPLTEPLSYLVQYDPTSLSVQSAGAPATKPSTR